MDRNVTFKAALTISLVLNAVLGSILFTDWLRERKAALGEESTGVALKSAISAKLLPRVRFEIRVAETKPGEGLVEIKNPETVRLSTRNPHQFSSIATSRARRLQKGL